MKPFSFIFILVLLSLFALSFEKKNKKKKDKNYSDHLTSLETLNRVPYPENDGGFSENQFFSSLDDNIVKKREKLTSSYSDNPTRNQMLNSLTVDIFKGDNKVPAVYYGIANEDLTVSHLNEIIESNDSIDYGEEPGVIDSYTNIIRVQVENSLNGIEEDVTLSVRIRREEDQSLIGLKFFQKGNPAELMGNENYDNSGYSESSIDFGNKSVVKKDLAVPCQHIDAEKAYYVMIELELTVVKISRSVFLLKECLPTFRDDFHMTLSEKKNRRHEDVVGTYELFNHSNYLTNKVDNDEMGVETNEDGFLELTVTYFTLDFWVEKGDLPIFRPFIYVDDETHDLQFDPSKRIGPFGILGLIPKDLLDREPEVEAIVTFGEREIDIIIGQNEDSRKNMTIEGAIICNEAANAKNYSSSIFLDFPFVNIIFI